jgi:hypothetical protein
MKGQLGNAMNMNEATLHLKLFKLVSEPDGVQSYMVNIINDLISKLRINSTQFNDCLAHNLNRKNVIYYGNPQNTKAYSKFVSDISKKTSKAIVLYNLDSNWSTTLKSNIIADAIKATNDKNTKAAFELLVAERKRKIDDDDNHGPRSFRSKT